MASRVLAPSSIGEPAVASALLPAVLVIESDLDSITQCGAVLDELGYQYHCASTAREAFDHIAANPAIQIMLTGMQIPTMDGFVLIEEVRARTGNGRAMAAIMLAERATTELAVKGLHIGAVDLLSKPLQFEACSAALRRAMRYLVERSPTAEDRSIAGIGQQITRLLTALEDKAVEPKADGFLTDKEIGAVLRTIIGSRGMRARFFPDELFADPAWDILLDLTRAKLDSQQVSVSSVCIAASVPMSTALRWVRQMTEAGLLQRWTDPKDRRRDLIALTDRTTGHMREYLKAVNALVQKL